MTTQDKSIECSHPQITAWYEENGEQVPLWSCTTCHRKFAPVESPTPSARLNEREGEAPETYVRSLLWDEFPECCGNPVTNYGGEYMGQREEVQSCCGCPEPASLSNAQIVASLRARFQKGGA